MAELAREQQSSVIQFPKSNQQIVVSPEQLQQIIQAAVDSALAPKKRSHKQTATDSLFKSDGVKKATKAEPFRTTEDYKKVCDYLMNHGREGLRVRNYTLVVVGCALGLRISDLLKLNRDLVFDSSGNIKNKIPMIDKKTGKRNDYVLVTETARKALELWDKTYGDSQYYLFFSCRNEKPMDETMAWRVISGAAKACGLGDSHGTHTLRKTFGYQAFEGAKKAGEEGEALELLQTKYGHTSQTVTMKYACISEDKIQKLAETASARLEGEI